MGNTQPVAAVEDIIEDAESGIATETDALLDARQEFEDRMDEDEDLSSLVADVEIDALMLSSFIIVLVNLLGLLVAIASFIIVFPLKNKIPNFFYFVNFVPAMWIVVIGAVNAALTYIWGSMVSEIEKLKYDTRREKAGLKRLKKFEVELRKEIAKEMARIRLERIDDADLKGELSKFEALRKDLERMAPEAREIGELAEHLNRTFRDMATLRRNNDIAFFTALFYDHVVQEDDGRLSMTERHYVHFEGDLRREERAICRHLGGFEAMDKDADGTVQIKDFLTFFHRVCDELDKTRQFLG